MDKKRPLDLIKRRSCLNSQEDEHLINHLLKLVQQQTSNPLFGVEDLALLLGVSRTKLNIKAKKILRCSPAKIILLNRLQKAAELLQTSDEPTKNVASLSGFYDYSSFWRAFQKHYRCSPVHFRSANQHSALEDFQWSFPPQQSVRENLIRSLQKNERLVRICDTIIHCIEHDKSSLASMARNASTSVSQLHRDTKYIFGISPMRLMLQFRLLKAVELIRDTSRSLSEIAYDAGFFDQAHFTRSFQDNFGLTPRIFRNLEKGFIFFSHIKRALDTQSTIR